MVNGPMQFGRSNDAQGSPTVLSSTSAATLTLNNSDQLGDVLVVDGGDIGITANADPTSENGIAILINGGRIGLKVQATTARGDVSAIQSLSDVRRGSAVLGMHTGTRGFGVIGEAQDNRSVGVYGHNTARGTGVLGRTNSNTRAAVLGDNTAAGAGVYGYSQTGYAGEFISGSACESGPLVGCAPPAGSAGLHVVGEIIKEMGDYAEAMPHPDGSKRLMYAPLSPESWYEDFGRWELIEGRAKVQLDEDFVAILGIEDGNYYVFLAPEGETKGLFVNNRTAHAFEVHEQQEGSNNLTFSYRVVAKRQNRQPERLARFEGHNHQIQRPRLDYPIS
jgi:hypothetical protein